MSSKNNRTKLYARALVEAIIKQGADENKIKENFLRLLERNGQMKKAREIVALAEDLFIKKTGRRKVVLETARKIKPKQKELLGAVLQKGDVVKEKINPELLAGIKIIINDEQLDLSMQKKLNNIF